MAVETQKTRISGRIWQAIAQSGVDLAAIPQDEMEKMVAYITESVMVEMDALLDEVELPQQPLEHQVKADVVEDTEEEKVLWEGRPFMSLVERYVVTNERVRIVSGLIGKGHEDIELVRVKDVDHTQGAGERLLNIGDVILHSADASEPRAVLRNVTDPSRVHEIIRRAMLNSRKRYPFVFEQEM